MLLRLAAFLGWAVSHRHLRPSLLLVWQTALSPAIVLPLAMMAAWLWGVVYAASSVGLWDMDLATDTAFWFVFAGLVLFGNFTHASRNDHFFRRKALAVLEIGVAVEVYSEFFVLPLPAEVILQLVLAVLLGVSAVATLRTEHRQVKALADGLLGAAAFALLAYVAVSLIRNWGVTDKGGLLRELALPAWLTVGVLPYVYAVGLVEAYRSTFRRIDWRSQADRWVRAQSKLALVATFHLRAREVGKVSVSLEFRLASTTSFREAWRVIREVRSDQLAGQSKCAPPGLDIVRTPG